MDEKAQTFTFEAAMSVLLIVMVLLHIVSAVSITPLTSSAANVQVENQLERYGIDILNVMSYKRPGEEYSPLKEALLYWDGETM